jgi:hypothetical protein
VRVFGAGTAAWHGLDANQLEAADDDAGPEAFTVETVTGRGAADPWRDYWTARQKISQKSFAAIRRLAA